MLQTLMTMIGARARAPVGIDTSLEISEAGWLQGPGVVRVPSVRHYALTSRDSHGAPAPLGITWHWTGGVCKPGHAASLAKRIATLKTGDREASWHVVISKQGDIYQSVSFEQGSWHCAVGAVPDPHRSGRTHRINRSLVGIELENAGRLKLLGGEWRCHPYWKVDKAGQYILKNGLKVFDPALVVAPERAKIVEGKGVFDVFPEPQIVAALRLLEALMRTYSLDPVHCRYLHGDFEPRKEDAGPRWQRILADWFDEAPPAPAKPLA
jgi:N-acetyl-anhydromuramyl-L-alanine amidase AmpD